jgi:hypothetical protein
MIFVGSAVEKRYSFNILPDQQRGEVRWTRNIIPSNLLNRILIESRFNGNQPYRIGDISVWERPFEYSPLWRLSTPINKIAGAIEPHPLFLTPDTVPTPQN